MTVQPHCKEGLQIFYSTHCLLFFLALESDQHQHPPEYQPRKISERSQDAPPPQIEQKPQIAQNAIPQAKPQPPTPIKLFFDFSLIYTVLRKAGNRGEQISDKNRNETRQTNEDLPPLKPKECHAAVDNFARISET